MLPSDLNSRSSTIALFVNLAKKSLGQPSYYKENRVIRASSPLRPWENDPSPYKILKSGPKLLKQNLSEAKRHFKRENKFLAFSFKSNKQGCSKEKKFVSEFVHHTNVSNYIKEYRASRHVLSEAEKKTLSREVEKAYYKLGIEVRSDRIQREKSKSAENASGDADSISKIEFVDVEDVNINTDDDDNKDYDDEPIPRSCGDDNSHSTKSSFIWKNLSETNHHENHYHLILPPIDHRTHQSISEISRTTALKVLNSYINNSKDGNGCEEIITKYRLSSFHSRSFCKSEERNNNERRFREARLPKVVVKKEATFVAKRPVQKKTRHNRVKLAKKTVPTNGVPGKSLPQITAEIKTVFEQSKLNAKPSKTQSPTFSQSCFNSISVLNATESHSQDTATSYSNRGQSVRDVVMASVKDLQPFSENELCENIQQIDGTDNTDHISKNSNNPKLISEIPKQSISTKIYHNLMFKPTTRKLVEELYVPLRETKRTGTTPYVVSGKPLYKLPPVKVQKQQLESKSLLQQKLHRRKGIPYTKSSMSIGFDQRHQAKSNMNQLNHLMPIKTHKSVVDNLAIHTKLDTVAKKQVVIKNAA